MRLGFRRKTIGAASGIILILVIGVAFELTFIDDGKPIVEKVAESPSPDTRWVATSEEVDNGLGFGLGMLYDEIHIVQSQEKISDHGDGSKTVVFYADAMGESNIRPRLEWIDATHLKITYSASRIEGRGPGKMLPHLHGVEIAYEIDPSK